MNSFDEVAAEVERIVDGDGRPIDEQVKSLVIGLRMQGIRTDSSCGGHPDYGVGYPWVRVVGDDTLKLVSLVARQNRPMLSSGDTNENQWVLKPAPSYMIDIIPQDTRRPLADMQVDAEEFGAFLQRLLE